MSLKPSTLNNLAVSIVFSIPDLRLWNFLRVGGIHYEGLGFRVY